MNFDRRASLHTIQHTNIVHLLCKSRETSNLINSIYQNDTEKGATAQKGIYKLSLDLTQFNTTSAVPIANTIMHKLSMNLD